MTESTLNAETRTKQIKEFFDEDSVRYLDQRYPSEPQNADQFSYYIRRQYVLEMLERIGTGGRLLDIGCGPGVLTPELVRRGWTVSAMDLSTGMLSAARRSTSNLPAGSVRFAAAQATHLPFRSGTFDAVICIGVVSYVNDVPALLADVRRVLRPGGQAIIQISNALGLPDIDGRVVGKLKSFVQKSGDSHDRFTSQVKLHPYRPGAFDTWCRQAGLDRREFRFFDFRMPRVISKFAPDAAFKAGRSLEILSRSSAATPFAAGYLVRLGRGDRR
jgi:ubiquinone/menaquinone biosynthesis C-methylase UbiE